MGFVYIYNNDIENIKVIVKLWGKQVEILIGIALAIIWFIASNRNKHYDDEDWEKIKDDWLKGEDLGE